MHLDPEHKARTYLQNHLAWLVQMQAVQSYILSGSAVAFAGYAVAFIYFALHKHWLHTAVSCVVGATLMGIIAQLARRGCVLYDRFVKETRALIAEIDAKQAAAAKAGRWRGRETGW